LVLRRSRKTFWVADEVRRRNLSRKERKVRKVLIEMTLAAKASKLHFRSEKPPSRWFADILSFLLQLFTV
jgi:hypothetical protein